MKQLVSALAVLVLGAGTASALPLEGQDRRDVAVLTFLVSQAIDGDLKKPKDGVGILGHLATSLESFQDAVQKLQDGNLSDDDKCVQGSKEDERGLAEAFRSVRDGVKLKAAQFNSQTAFDLRRATRGSWACGPATVPSWLGRVRTRPL